MTCSRISQAEVEPVVAFTVAAPPRRAPASGKQFAAVAIAVFVLAVGIVHSSNLESVGRL